MLPVPGKRRYYGVGMEKTGTHSLAKYLGLPHQPHSDELIGGVLGWIDKYRVVPLLQEPCVSNLLVHYLDELLKIRDAEFVLTTRDPVSWLRSSWNHGTTLGETRTPAWIAMDVWRKGKDGDVESCLKYWEWHNKTVLETIPSSRLHVVPVASLPIKEYVGDYSSGDPLHSLDVFPLAKKVCPTWWNFLK